MLLALTGSAAQAQTIPPEAPPAAAEPAPPAAAPAVVSTSETSLGTEVPPTPPPAAAPAPVVEPVPPPPPPAAEEKKDPRGMSMTMNAWGRFGFVLQDPNDPEELDHLSHNAEVDLLMEAQIIEMVGLTANFVGTYGPSATGDVISGNISIMDLIAKFNFADSFHIWAGRMLVPSDRSNFSGPWFIAPWNYPGIAGSGPRQGPSGRNDGATIWGQAAGGMFKYYAGAYDLYSSTGGPLFSGRVSLSLLNPEPGYYGSSTFYGKDLLGIGVGVQYKKDGSGGDDYTLFNADILFEKDLGKLGVLDVEGAFYKYQGDAEKFDLSYFALASYLIRAKIGPGMLQPLVRYQGATSTDEDEDDSMLIDAQIGYVVEAFACRFALGYQYSEVQGQKGNSIFLGIQLMK